MKIKPVAWFLLFLLGGIWGSSFILIKKSLLTFTPLQSGALRICIAGWVMLPILWMHRHSVKPRHIKYSVLFGLCNAGIPAFLFAYAGQKLPSSMSGILNSLAPLFNLLIGAMFFSVRFTMPKLVGVLIGLCGAVVIIAFGRSAQAGQVAEPADWIYYMLPVIGTVLYGFSGNLIKSHLQDAKAVVISAISYFAFTIPFTIWLCFTDLPERLATSEFAWQSSQSLLILGCIGSALAVTLVSKLVQASSALFGSFTTYIIPVTALLWGVMDGEKVQGAAILGLLLILAGILVSTIPLKRRQSQPEEVAELQPNAKEI